MAHQHVTGEDIFFLEEETIHSEAIKKLEKELAQGKTLDQACETLSRLEKPLKSVIIDDLLKIILAEYHFNEGRGLDDIALLLGITYEKIVEVKISMINELQYSFGADFQNEYSHLASFQMLKGQE